MEINVKIEASELSNSINSLAVSLLTLAQNLEMGLKCFAAAGVAASALPENKEVVKKVISDAQIEIEQTTVTEPPVPLAEAPKFTKEDIMKAGAELMDAGKINELRALISSFGVEAVTSLKPEQLGEFATGLRKLGAKI